MRLFVNLWPGQCLLAALALASSGLRADSSEQEHRHHSVHLTDHEHDVLEEVRVTATPLSRNVIEMSQSATVLDGAVLNRELSNNIGDTLSRIPGLSNASFGQNVGRPVIRGLEGARVGVLSNNMGAADASAVSQDHAVSVEPFLADQIEVLKGPSTLLYGSGSIGGVVNIVTHTIPFELPEDGFAARAMVQGDSAADQRLAAARLDFGIGSFAFHANGFYRRSDDYEIPGAAELHSEEHEEDDSDHEGEHEDDRDDEMSGVLENSFLDNDGGTLGASWIGGRWRVGAAYTIYDSDYGIPGAHAHEHEEHEGEHEEESGHDDEGEEENVTIGLESQRLEGEIVGTDPFRGFERLKFRLADTDYTHTEFEGAEVGTVFNNDSTDLRLELRHEPWSNWNGAFGVQYSDRDFEAIGDEAFVPPSETRTKALFWVENAEFENWQADLGVRYDRVDVEAWTQPGTGSGVERNRTFSPLSAALGVVYHLDDSKHLAFNLSYAERAPTDQELFANGPHLATQTYEVGDALLNKESNFHSEIGFRVHEDQLTCSITLYYDSFSDYIYQLDTGIEEDGLPLRQWSQQDASFYGGELELRYDLGHLNSGHWQVFGFADLVRAEFKDNSNVPRIPPVRFGLGVDWDVDQWAGNLTWINASSHTRIADYETPTPGYNLLSAELSFLFPGDRRANWEAYLKGHNLLNEDIRNSTSFLKDQAPQIGRNFVLGLRVLY
jgi:iron complex outermembrane receptor protein